MAPKTATPPAPPVPDAPTTAFLIDWHDAPPPRTTGVAGAGRSNELSDTLKALAAPENGRFQSFFVPAEIADSIKPEEQAQAFKDAQRKLSSRITGAARRINKDDETKKFATRNVVENDVIGVRVWRVEAA